MHARVQAETAHRYYGHWCHAGGRGGGHRNYGYPCVRGAIYWEDGSVTDCPNCVFCGRLPDAEELL